MSDIIKLTRKRGTIKASFTRIKGYVENNESHETDQLDIRAARVREVFKEFEQIETEIELLRDDEMDIKELAEFEESYLTLLAIIQAKINSVRVATTNQNSRDSVNTNIAVVNASRSEVKLPTINLPEFSGRFEEWKGFSDAFKSMIDQNSSVAPVQKLHYLRSYLKNEVANVIQSIETTAQNYEVAWKLLEERYENERIIIQSHVRALFELIGLTKESATGLHGLIDIMLKNVRALEALKQPTDQWDALLLHLITSKLDKVTHREWERSIDGKKLPTFQNIIEFLRKRCHVLEAVEIETTRKMDKVSGSQTCTNVSGKNRVLFSAKFRICALCKQKHFLQNCPDFLKLNLDDRLNKVKKLGLCINCLKFGHLIAKCKSGSCSICSKRHHTTLHFENKNCISQLSEVALPATQQVENSTSHRALYSFDQDQVLLSTAIVDILDVHGNYQKCRIILDHGSQSNLITEKLSNKLGLVTRPVDNLLSGIGSATKRVKRALTTTIKSRFNNYSLELNFLIIPQITDLYPTQRIDKSILNLPSNIKLADPRFNDSSEIDALLGAEHFYFLLCIGQIVMKNGITILQKTRFGWVVGGKSGVNQKDPKGAVCCLSLDILDRKVSRFLEMEEIPPKRFLSPEENSCEEHFVKNVSRDATTGKYTLRLPFRESTDRLGSSYAMEKRRLLSTEKRMARYKGLQNAYQQFLREHEDLNHMTKTSTTNVNDYILPHHAVYKTDSSTTKVRIVFDASSKTETGKSLRPGSHQEV